MMFVALVGLSYYLGYTPVLVLMVFVLASLITYRFYAKDKKAAIKGDWRVPEKTLHGLALCCGWPGALIAQARLRHKTKKVSFLVVFWITVLANSAAFVWLHSSQGNNQLHNGLFHLENMAMANIQSSRANDVVLFLTQYRPRHPFLSH